MKNRLEKKQRRINKIKAMITGKIPRPRLTVSKSNKYTSAQLIDDEKRITIVSAGISDLSKESVKGKTKTEIAGLVGGAIAKKAVEKNIKKIVFDRRGYKYHGRIKNLAEKAREAGLEF